MSVHEGLTCYAKEFSGFCAHAEMFSMEITQIDRGTG